MTALPAEDLPDADGHLWHSPQFVIEWIRLREDLASNHDRARHAEEQKILLAAGRRLDREHLRLLDLGAGWGRFIKTLLNEFRQSTAVALDFSQPMLEAAKTNLGNLADRVEFVCQDLTNEHSITDLNGQFDLIFSSQTLHHFEPGSLRHIYQKIAQILSPGGIFLNFDRVSRPPSLAARLAYRAAIEFPFSAVIPWETRRVDQFTLGLDRKLTDIFGQGKRRAHDVMLAEHVDLMEAAGLTVAWRPLSPQRFMLCGKR